MRRFYYLKIPKAQFKPSVKIISIGNIVSGGTGKTPVTIYLSDLLRKSYKIAICHRGYKGDFENSNKIISDREKIYDIAKKAGDEPFLLAKKLKNIPVAVGKNRTESIKLLQEKFPDLDFIILDDSFQHLQVKHNFDIVVFNSIGKAGNGFVLPSGILRESLNSLKYADKIIVNGDSKISELKKFSKKIIYGKYEVIRIYDKNNKNIKLNKLKNSKNILLSAIGLPKSFEKTVKSKEISFQKHFILKDHANYNKDKIKEIENFVLKNKVEYILTTEKDFAKLSNIQNNLNLAVIAIDFKIEDTQLKDEIENL